MDNYNCQSSLAHQVSQLFHTQLSDWELAKSNYSRLNQTISREIEMPIYNAVVQFNPGRIRSASAKVDAKSLNQRPCFLCDHNRPKEQMHIDYLGKYRILINPFPIFRQHLTIPAIEHTPQLIAERVSDMLSLSELLTDYVIFYNGAKCGASAPDHMHFQAGEKGIIPFQESFNKTLSYLQLIEERNDSVLAYIDQPTLRAFVLSSSYPEQIQIDFQRIMKAAAILQPSEAEPMMNILCWQEKENWKMVIYLRRAHRPKQYYETGDKQILISPASVEMGGLFVLAQEKDFLKMNADILTDVLGQILITSDEMKQIINKL